LGDVDIVEVAGSSPVSSIYSFLRTGAESCFCLQAKGLRQQAVHYLSTFCNAFLQRCFPFLRRLKSRLPLRRDGFD
jgi:hypothetical protein